MRPMARYTVPFCIRVQVLMILAGDIGGTKSNLALFGAKGGRLHSLFQRRFSNKDYKCFPDVVSDFCRQATISVGVHKLTLKGAGFGVAGTIVDGLLHSGNLPWEVDTCRVAEELDLAQVVLLND